MEQERIGLASQLKPGLTAGVYTLEARQESTIPGSTVEPAFFSFRCGADPLCMPQSDVYSVYPPRDAFGTFERVLPNLVFTNKTLPWERDVAKAEKLPWLALLLFDETEDAAVRSLPSKEAFTPETGRYCPVVYDSSMAADCMVLDVAAGLFAGVCPDAGDLSLCAHARCVCRDNKVTEENPPEEWLSVLLSTRYPAAVPGGKGIKNSCYVVSVEQFGEFLTDPSLRAEIAGEQMYTTVRVPLLYSWSFYCATEEFDFKTVFEGLDTSAFQLPEIRKNSLPEELRNLLKMGYAPVDHQLRDASSTVSFYRGPFAAYRERDSGMKPKMNGDAWLHYDPDMGMFDISYSAAYCLGRQLALQNGSYSAALHTWRSTDKALAAGIRQRYRLACGLGAERDIRSRCLALMEQEREGAGEGRDPAGIEGTGQFAAVLEAYIKEMLAQAANGLVSACLLPEERKL